MDASLNYFRSEQPIQQRYFTAPQIARMIGETPVTVRYWALEFGVYRKGGQHTWHYTRESVARFHIIKELLRNAKYTIAGAKLQLSKMTNFNYIEL
jgi:DNA-binding transcriptional MerR regulator